jgi:hypothetical protein
MPRHLTRLMPLALMVGCTTITVQTGTRPLYDNSIKGVTVTKPKEKACEEPCPSDPSVIVNDVEYGPLPKQPD